MEALQRFVMKHMPTSPPLKIKKPKNEGYINWENVGNDVDRLTQWLTKKAGVNR